ncbi:MAG: hypothetical protein KJO07_02660 [Deltaproteobacteria bacterium]|jgi:hypothetical protein|nr:hypothetical protein [Deltaproteobacteria bacterium]
MTQELMTPQELNREVPYSARRRDRAVLFAFAVSWLATLALASTSYLVIDDNRELRAEVHSLRADVAFANTAVVLERVAGHERELQVIAELIAPNDSPPVVATAPESKPSKTRPSRSPDRGDRNRDRNRDRVTCKDDSPLGCLGMTESLR